MRRKYPELSEGMTIQVNYRPVFSTEEGFNAADAEVVDLLSVQFSARLLDGTDTLTYRFYHDYETTWRLKP